MPFLFQAHLKVLRVGYLYCFSSSMQQLFVIFTAFRKAFIAFKVTRLCEMVINNKILARFLNELIIHKIEPSILVVLSKVPFITYT